MPFTLAHPAAAVPLTRWSLPLSALVIGSLSPDFVYFICLSAAGNFGHTLPGLFLMDLPAGLVGLWLFHTLLKYPLLILLPVNHQKRLWVVAQGFRFGPGRQFLLILLALLIGAMTHILWDSFTHGNRWIVQNSFLSASLLVPSYGDLKIYRLLQHSSTLIGSGLLIYWYSRWLRATLPVPVEPPRHLAETTKLWLVGLMGLGAMTIALLYSLLSGPPVVSLAAIKPLIGRTVITTISALFIELLIFGLAWRLMAVSGFHN